MRRHCLSLLLALGLAAPLSVARAQDASADKNAFEFKHAWIAKTQKIRENRERYINERGFYDRDLMPASQRALTSVTGRLTVPVFCVKFSDTGEDPYPVSQLQARLFDGPYSPMTAREYYREVSYGDLDISGTVYGWTTLPNPEAYYVGPGDCEGTCLASNVRELVESTLAAYDATIDFGQFDNDGPDGIPNSGDDDGYVDLVSFIQAAQGGECVGGGHIRSHRSTAFFQTNDPRAGGGFIRAADYTIQTAYQCGTTLPVNIGVFCHEWGHALGLPDLYDTDYGSQGVGFWCLMGLGGSNTHTQPSHPCAWSKSFLGWANEVEVPAVPALYNIQDVETHREVYRLNVMRELWRRRGNCALDGSYSMRCSLNDAEASMRHWASGEGYGNNWDTTVARDFDYNGSGPVTLQYRYAVALEPRFDYAYGIITAGSTTRTFASYTGVDSGTANIDLTPYLSQPTPYTISFRVISDPGYSDEDGGFATTCGAMAFDNISLNGGGESYFTNFEKREDGWAQTMPSEYFLVENRQPIGSDAHLIGGGGLLIWHIDNADQTGGPSNNRPRGVELVQADGRRDLEHNFDGGDEGDPYPGSTNNRTFNGASNPNSDGHDGPSTVAVTRISANGNPMTATMKGGWPAPVVKTITPSSSKATPVALEIDGLQFAKTPSVDLVHGSATISATSVYWAGKDRIIAQLDMTNGINGYYDVVVFNPGGASAALTGAFRLTGGTGAEVPPYSFALFPAYPNPFNPRTTIRYELASRQHVLLRVYDVSGAVVRTLVNETKAAGSYTLTWDGRNDHDSAVSSGVYFYRITAGSFSDVRKVTLVK